MTLNTSEVRQKRKKSPFICLMSRSDLVSFQWKSKDSLKGWNWMQWNICQAWFVVLLSVTHTFDPTCVFLVTDAQHTHFQLFVQWQHSSDYSSIWLEQLLRLTHTFIQPQLHQRKEADHHRSVCPHTDCSQTTGTSAAHCYDEDVGGFVIVVMSPPSTQHLSDRPEVENVHEVARKTGEEASQAAAGGAEI